MSVTLEYLNKLQAYEYIDREKKRPTNLMPLDEAMRILQEFEIALIRNLDCEELEYLKSKL